MGVDQTVQSTDQIETVFERVNIWT